MTTAASAGPRRGEASGLSRWGIVLAATAVLAVTAGGRFLIGVVLDDVRDAFGLGYGWIGAIVSANQLVIGLAQPAVGRLVDRFAARYVAAGGLLLLGGGLMVMGLSHSVWPFVAGYGFLVALGLAAASPVTVTPLVAGWFARRRATALSIVNSGGSLGQLAIVPGLALLVKMTGWRDAYLLLGGGLALLGTPLMLALLRERAVDRAATGDLPGCSLRRAVGARSFYQLAFGFFVCGFTMSWVMTYFFDFSATLGVSRERASLGMSIMGGMSLVGLFATGWWADRGGRSLPLAAVYALRGLGFGLLFLAGGGLPVLLLAMAVIGFSWASTVPLTSALCADIYGRRTLGAIFGLMFAVMPVGSAAGSALSGYLVQTTGSYDASLLINLGAGLLAGLGVLAVRVAPIFRRTPIVEPVPALLD